MDLQIVCLLLINFNLLLSLYLKTMTMLLGRFMLLLPMDILTFQI